MRNVVSYDDIADSYDAPPRPPPNKKRRKGHQNTQHANHKARQDIEEEMSRELTQEEIWDDSALISAWDAANAEYEAYHGPDKGWKNKPVDSSPLWYNVPPNPSKGKQKSSQTVNDSQPISFDTFVPTHDASLKRARESSTEEYEYPEMPFGALTYPTSSSSAVSQEEAFQRAMNAMYWTGYWSAMHQMKAKQNTDDIGIENEYSEVVYANGALVDEEEKENPAEEEEVIEDVVPLER